MRIILVVVALETRCSIHDGCLDGILLAEYMQTDHDSYGVYCVSSHLVLEHSFLH